MSEPENQTKLFLDLLLRYCWPMTVTSSNFALRENDLYETEPWAVDAVLRALVKLHLWEEGSTIWEPSAGNHAMVRPLRKAGAGRVLTSDICKYTRAHTAIFDFLSEDQPSFLPDTYSIITNPTAEIKAKAVL